MRANRSYVFFRVLPGAPVGAAGVELTPGRSLAVDTRFLPFGLPLWLDATLPALPELGRARGGAARAAWWCRRTAAARSRARCAATSSGAPAPKPKRSPAA